MADGVATQVPLPQLFVSEDGSQLRVFVEAGGILGRPKIVRNLRKSGGLICSDPKQAEVILVDSTTNQGKRFIRDWGRDEDKVVLEYTWVSQCLAMQKLLKGPDQWGGCMTYDDGSSLEEPEEGEDDKPVNPPLPTPRITPIETAQRPPAPTPLPSSSSGSGSSKRSQNVELDLTTSTPSQGISQFAAPPSQTQPTPQPAPQPVPQSWMTPQGQVDLQAFYASHTQQNQPILAVSPGFSNAFLNPTLLVALQNSIQNLGHNPWLSQNPSLQSVYANLQQAAMELVRDQPNLATNTFSGPSAYPATQSEWPSTSLEVPPKAKPMSHSSNSDTPATSSKGRQRKRSESVSDQDIINPPRSQASGASSPQLFKLESGEELSFFVQIDLNDRFSLVNNIKKHGGVITNNHTTADFSILYSRSRTFNNLLNSTYAADKLPVSAAFVRDSVAKGRLLDPLDYVFGLPEKSQRKRSRPSPTKVREGSVNEKKRRRKSDVSEMAVEEAVREPRSPTPPPEHTHIRRGFGYAYSTHDREYLSRYLDVLLERDHQMPMQTLARHVFRKLPHHTLKSWNMYLLQNARDEIETIRKRKAIAYRKAQRLKGSPQNEGRSTDLEITSSSTSPPAPPLSPSRQHDDEEFQHRLESDLQIISHFFATAGGEEGEEEIAIWARLTHQAECQTADSWEDFYNTHHAAINERYQKLIDLGGDQHGVR